MRGGSGRADRRPRRRPARRGHHRIPTRRRDRRGRLGQDPRAHPADRLPHRDRHGRAPPHARVDLHPRGRRRDAPTAPAPRAARPRGSGHVPLGDARRTQTALGRHRTAAPHGGLRSPTAPRRLDRCERSSEPVGVSGRDRLGIGSRHRCRHVSVGGAPCAATSSSRHRQVRRGLHRASRRSSAVEE